MKSSTVRILMVVYVCVCLLCFIPNLPPDYDDPDRSDLELRVMTYNLHFGIDEDGNFNLKDVQELVAEVNPDVVGFQEVTFNSPTNGFANMLGELSERMDNIGFSHAYWSEGGKQGLRNAVFSRHEIVETETIELEPVVSYQRTAERTVIRVGNKEIAIYTLHLTHIFEERTNPERVRQAEQVMTSIAADALVRPVVLMGDFNSEPDWPEIQVFTASMIDVWGVIRHDVNGFTWPSRDPTQRLDYIFISPGLDITGCEIISTRISDHLPLFADLEIAVP